MKNKLRASFFVVVMLTLAACGGGSDGGSDGGSGGGSGGASDVHDDTGAAPHDHPSTTRPR
jgi:hypothetical protein